MEIKNRVFPYPLLHEDKIRSQYKNSTFIFQFDEIMDCEKNIYRMTNIKSEITNEELRELISNNKASIFCLVECASTMFRRIYKISDDIDIEIDGNLLNGEIRVFAYLVAMEDLNSFHSKDFDDDYLEHSFEIDNNSVLAANVGFRNKISSDWNNDVESFFIIIPDKESRSDLMLISYDSSKIQITLPENQWNKYNQIKKSKNWKTLFFSIFVIPSLSYCIMKLRESEEDFESLKIEFSWLESFCYSYERKKGSILDEEEFKNMNPFVAIQEIMDNPVKDAIDKIYESDMRGIEENEQDD